MSLDPGWYRDPAEPTTQRWWDGEGWIGDPLPADQTPPPGPPPVSGSGEAGDRLTTQLPAVPGPPGAAESPALPPAGEDRKPHDRAGSPGRAFGKRPAGRQPAGSWRSAGTEQLTPPEQSARRQVSSRPHGYPLAMLGARFIARLVDIGIVLALNVAVNGWFVYQYWQEVSPVLGEAWRRSLAGDQLSDLPEVGDQAGYLQLVILILAAALWFAYEVPAVANTGQTPGKRLLKIKVVALEQDQPLSFGRSLRRWNPMGLPVLLWWCFGIGFLLQLIDAGFALFDRPAQQALHDRSAHTAVVSVAEPPSDTERTSKETADEPADPS